MMTTLSATMGNQLPARMLATNEDKAAGGPKSGTLVTNADEVAACFDWVGSALSSLESIFGFAHDVLAACGLRDGPLAAQLETVHHKVFRPQLEALRCIWHVRRALEDAAVLVAEALGRALSGPVDGQVLLLNENWRVPPDRVGCAHRCAPFRHLLVARGSPVDYGVMADLTLAALRDATGRPVLSATGSQASAARALFRQWRTTLTTAPSLGALAQLPQASVLAQFCDEVVRQIAAFVTASRSLRLLALDSSASQGPCSMRALGSVPAASLLGHSKGSSSSPALDPILSPPSSSSSSSSPSEGADMEMEEAAPAGRGGVKRVAHVALGASPALPMSKKPRGPNLGSAPARGPATAVAPKTNVPTKASPSSSPSLPSPLKRTVLVAKRSGRKKAPAPGPVLDDWDIVQPSKRKTATPKSVEKKKVDEGDRKNAAEDEAQGEAKDEVDKEAPKRRGSRPRTPRHQKDKKTEMAAPEKAKAKKTKKKQEGDPWVPLDAFLRQPGLAAARWCTLKAGTARGTELPWRLVIALAKQHPNQVIARNRLRDLLLEARLLAAPGDYAARTNPGDVSNTAHFEDIAQSAATSSKSGGFVMVQLPSSKSLRDGVPTCKNGPWFFLYRHVE